MSECECSRLLVVPAPAAVLCAVHVAECGVILRPCVREARRRLVDTRQGRREAWRGKGRDWAGSGALAGLAAGQCVVPRTSHRAWITYLDVQQARQPQCCSVRVACVLRVLRVHPDAAPHLISRRVMCPVLYHGATAVLDCTAERQRRRDNYRHLGCSTMVQLQSAKYCSEVRFRFGSVDSH